MKQLFQNLRTGNVEQTEVPTPATAPGCLLIQTSKTLISPGTERMLAEFGKAGWFAKAKQQPEKVKQVLQKIKADGLKPTLEAVSHKLNQPLAVGYCNAGVVVEVGSGVSSFQVGDRVISNGPHAEFVCVPENLCAKIPDNVEDSTACFTVLSAIALQGVRLIAPELGETIAVQGLGLIGLLTCQILKANGCRVIGFDFDAAKVELAREFGVQAHNISSELDPVKAALEFSDGNGVDAVVITAATSSNDPIRHAPQMCRKRGRVVLVGVVGLDLKRSDFYEKEISFQVSCSYGPGRYESVYEEQGLDYPIGFVRWTEQRNFQAVLQLMSDGLLKTEKLQSATISFSEAGAHYDKLLEDRSSLGILLTYENAVLKRSFWTKKLPARIQHESTARIGFIGAGNFASRTLIPLFAKTKAELIGIASNSGVNATKVVKKFSFACNTTDDKELLTNKNINTIVVATQHNTHAELTMSALKAGKHVFVEKPLALNREELNSIQETYEKHRKQVLMVGFNRRFAPLTTKIKELLSERASPLTMSITVNPGAIPANTWIQDPSKGGGRILGEACHFIDFLSFICGAPIVSVYASSVGSAADGICNDKASIHLNFADGSIGTVHYFANGHKNISKERLEIFSDGRVLLLNNFYHLDTFGFKKFKKLYHKKQDKGYKNEIQAFLSAISGQGPAPIPFSELYNVSLATISAVESQNSGRVIEVAPLEQQAERKRAAPEE